MKVFIYILKDPITHLPNYVGKSNEHRIKKRLNEHCQLNRLQSNTHKNNWIKKLLSNNRKPILQIIDECNEINAKQKEQYWCNCYKRIGIKLTNSTIGGEGRIVFNNRVISYSQKLQISTTLKKYFSNKDNRQNCSIAGKASRGKIKSRNTSGYIGVTKCGKKWRASIVVDYKQLHLGCFPTPQLAYEAYFEAAVKYH